MRGIKRDMNEKTVGMLSRFTGVSVHTIKYYEKIGLLTSNRMEQSNYRSYDVRSCTDIYESVKYRNMGFSLKEVKELLQTGTDERLAQLMEARERELEAEDQELRKKQMLVREYRRQLSQMDRKLGKWYIEECPDFYYRCQTTGLNYKENACMEAEGVNLVDYAPLSCSVLEVRPEYFRDMPGAFAWGWGLNVPEEGECDPLSDKKEYQRIRAGRCFVIYDRLTDQYASQGLLRDKFLNYYHEWKTGVPVGTVYAFRIKVTKDETGKTWDYMKMILPLETEN